MKSFSALLIPLLALGAVSLRAETAAELDRSSAELAARLVLQSLGDDAAKGAVPPETLLKEIEAKPADHVDPARSKEALRPVFEKAVGDRYREEAVKLLDRLAGDRGRAEMFSGDFLKEAETAPAAVLTSAVEKGYGSAFDTARAKACETQRASLKASVNPSEEEVDRLSKDELERTLTERVAAAQGIPVFQENLGYISSEIVRPMVRDAYGQRDEQKAFLKNAVVVGALPRTLEETLSARLNEYIEERRRTAEGGKTVYGVFPSVTKDTLPAAALERAVRNLCDAIGDVPFDVPQADLVKLFEADPKAHQKKGASQKLVGERYRESLFELGLKRASDAASDAASEGERGELPAFARSVKDRNEIKQAVERRVQAVVFPAFLAAREARASAQLDAAFKDVMSGTWFPAPAPVDEAATAADVRDRIRRWRGIDGMVPFADRADAAVLLEEAAARLNAAIEDAFGLGVKAQRRQIKDAESAQSQLKDDLIESAAKPSFEEAVRLLTSATEKRWAESRPETLKLKKDAPDDGRHAELFPSVRKHIELLAKALLEALQAAQTPPKPEEPVVQEEPPLPPPEELEEIPMDCVIQVNRKGAELQLRLLVNDKEISTKTSPHTLEAYRKGIHEALDGLTGDLVKVYDEAVKKNRLKVTVTIDVLDDFVYYGVVNGLSSQLKKDSELFEGYITSFDVSDGLQESE